MNNKKICKDCKDYKSQFYGCDPCGLLSERGEPVNSVKLKDTNNCGSSRISKKVNILPPTSRLVSLPSINQPALFI